MNDIFLLNDVDLRNGAGAPKTSDTPDVSNINSELANLNQNFEKLNSMKSTLLNVAQNSTVMIDWVKQDVVALQVCFHLNS